MGTDGDDELDVRALFSSLPQPTAEEVAALEAEITASERERDEVLLAAERRLEREARARLRRVGARSRQ
jgi:hypothetical protein